METVEVNLCRALKVKNRLASRLSRLDQLITQHNSCVQGHREYDIKTLYKQRMLLAEQLVGIKVAISNANIPIQKQIYEVAECKALCKTLSEIDTSHGPKSLGVGESVQHYEAQFRATDVQKELRKVEREVDRLQDELDQFNLQTRISIPQIWLDEPEEGSE